MDKKRRERTAKMMSKFQAAWGNTGSFKHYSYELPKDLHAVAVRCPTCANLEHRCSCHAEKGRGDL